MPLSTWPLTPLPIRAELFISGAWTDITSRVRLENEINITGRGRQTEQGRPGVCTCNLTLNNRDGFFSTRAPSSVNFGKLGKNTPFRVSVTEDRSFALIDTVGTSRVKTTDKASLDIVGDLDVRIEYEIDNPNTGVLGFILAAKYRRSTPDRSWVLFVGSTGYVQFNWTTDGSTISASASTAPISPQYGPLAIRATIDVDNGAAGRTITFYTSDTISGTWTQLGAPVVQAGITSIFSGTGELELGRIDDGQNGGINGVTGMTGRIYGFELRNGIGGTLVANAAIYNQPRGTTSWSDGLTTPNTWTTNGNAEITPDDRRFYGEMINLPQQWDLSGKDVYVPAQAADVTRRLQQGGVALFSSWKKYWLGAIATGLSSTTPVTGYWPFEDGSISQQAANLVPSGAPGTISDAVFSKPADLPATAGSITINSAASRFSGVARRRATGNNSFCNFAFKMAAIPASSTTLIDLYGQNDIGRINISVSNVNFDVALYDQNGVLITSNSTSFPASTPPNKWVVMRVQTSQSGGTGQVDLGWYAPNDNTQYGAAALTFTGTAGIITGYVIKATTQNIGTQYAHLAIGNYFLDNTAPSYVIVANAFNGETSTARFTRVCTENGITGKVIGQGVNLERMGPQPQVGVMDVLYECSDVEQGIIYPDRNSASLILRTRRSLINQYGPSINYAAGELGAQAPQPTDDDALIRNTVTASRAGGSSAVATVTTGPNSTASPIATPPGAGVYTASVSRNTYTDDRLSSMAQWEAFLGTWDEPRWPQVRMDLERSPYTGSVVKIRKGHILSQVDVGDVFTLTGLIQAGVAPDDAILLVQGLTETLGNKKWWLQWNTSPAGPFYANDQYVGALTNSRQRVAAANCTVTTGFTSTATGVAAFQVSTAAGSTLWGTTAAKPGNFPLNVVIAGEVITISGITNTTSPQSFNVSARGVNSGGVGKAHLAGEAVQVQYPMTVAL